MLTMLLLAGCANEFPYLYDHEYYEAALLCWTDDDKDGFREVDGDCDDTRVDINPDAEEVCNELDDDCDDEADDSALDAKAWYQDVDADGFGNTAVAYVGCDEPTGFSQEDGDCDDEDATRSPGATEKCEDAVDVNCDGKPGNIDADSDGFPLCEGDCDDENAAVNPIAEEVCNGNVDDDCDGEADGEDALGATEWYLDADNDGHGTGGAFVQCLATSDYALLSDDCNDEDPEVFPGTTEICDNGQDDNCDGDDNGCRTEGLMPVEGRLTGPGRSNTGVGLRGPGDLNGDGFDDLLVSAGSLDDYPDGAVFLVDGPISGDHDLATTSRAVLSMPASGDVGIGATIEVLGDLGADGTTDWAIGGGEGGDYPNPYYGVIYVVPEQSISARVDQVSLVRVWETAGDTLFATYATAPGDIDGDGSPDLLLGAAASEDYSGAAYILTSLEGDMDETDASWVGRGERGSSYGADMAAHDYDGDGAVDVVVGAPAAASEAGTLLVYLGPLGGEVATSDADAAIVGDAESVFGITMCDAGDANDDGKIDLWVIAVWSDLGADNGGSAYLFTDLTHTGSAASLNGAIVAAETADSSLGYQSAAIAADDMDGDAIPDLLIGAPGYDDGVNNNAGKAYLLYGPFSPGLTSVSAASAWHIGSTESAGAGAVLSIPGDLDGDGNLDIAVQELGELDGTNDRVNLLYGYAW